MSTALVSILIPVYNRDLVVKTTLTSIKEQTYTNWECILVDDGSTDNTLKVIKEYVKNDNRFKYVSRPANMNKGANSCRNYGFSLANGVYVNWFDSDDIMLPDFLEKKVGQFQPNIDAVLHRNKYADSSFSNFRDSKFQYTDFDSLFKDYALETIEIQTCGFMWRKEYLENKNLFNEYIQRYQDNEFHIRMLSLKPELKILNSVLAIIRTGNSDADQISSVANISPKKLYDIFFYRYQCLKLAENTKLWEDLNYKKIISKKALWTFYAALKKEEKLIKRIKDLKGYYNSLDFIFKNESLSFLEIIKSKAYLLKLLLLR